jgi:hypothetical protein
MPPERERRHRHGASSASARGGSRRLVVSSLPLRVGRRLSSRSRDMPFQIELVPVNGMTSRKVNKSPGASLWLDSHWQIFYLPLTGKVNIVYRNVFT